MADAEAASADPIKDSDRLAARQAFPDVHEDLGNTDTRFDEHRTGARSAALRGDLGPAEQAQLATDADLLVRARLAKNDAALDPGVFEVLADDPELWVIAHLASRRDLSLAQANGLHDRYWALPLKVEGASRRDRATVLPIGYWTAKAWDQQVRIANLVWGHPLITTDRLGRYVGHPDIGPTAPRGAYIPDGIREVLTRPSCPPAMLRQYATSRSSLERMWVALGAPYLPPDLDALLAHDPDSSVAHAYRRSVRTGPADSSPSVGTGIPG